MKKIIFFLLILFLSGCSSSGLVDSDSSSRYYDLINIIHENESFISESNYYDISVEMAKIEDGYRYYVTIDDAHAAMYNIEMIAIEKDVDYSNLMAANIGIFDEMEYNMIPNQSNVSKGFVEGLVISGTTEKESTTLYILVEWYNKDFSNQYRELFQIETSYQSLYE